MHTRTDKCAMLNSISTYMKKNKFTEIRNRAAYIHDLLGELEEVIKEAELDADINTKRIVDEGNRMVDATVNDLEGYDLDDEKCKFDCITKVIFIAGAGLVILAYCVFY